jgi:hypothetical protein
VGVFWPNCRQTDIFGKTCPRVNNIKTIYFPPYFPELWFPFCIVTTGRFEYIDLGFFLLFFCLVASTAFSCKKNFIEYIDLLNFRSSFCCVAYAAFSFSSASFSISGVSPSIPEQFEYYGQI